MMLVHDSFKFNTKQPMGRAADCKTSL